MKNPTIADVASRAGVSKATVSAVINDKGTVKDSTRRRVLRSIQELNYRPNASARRHFRASAARSIGLVVKEAENPYFAELAAGVRDLAEEKGYTILLASSEGACDAEKRVVDLLSSKDVDGLIINPLLDDRADLSHIFDLKRHNVPFVLLEEVRGVQASLVDVDNVEAAQMTVEHLIERGHERIVHFAGPSYSTHSGLRVQGVRRAFSESHLAFSDAHIIEAGARLREGYDAACAYFDAVAEDERPTGVTCYNDLVAIGLLRALHERGLQVPGDVSVIGHDDLNLLEFLPQPLTSVRMPKFEMGRRAAEMLIRQTEANEMLAPEKLYLDTELIQRSSVATLN